MTEGIFSMDGDSAPLAEVSQAARAVGALLLVDDAHGIGALGEEGRGSCYAQQVRPDLLIVTFGKAFGVSGAAVLCSEALADYLLQFARHLIYSTAMPPAQAVALSAALYRDSQRRGSTAAGNAGTYHIADFRRGMSHYPGELTDSGSAIQPLIVGDNARALRLAARLREEGCWATVHSPADCPRRQRAAAPDADRRARVCRYRPPAGGAA